MFDLFPAEFVERCIGLYAKDHGVNPKVLCANEDDYANWILTGSINSANQLGLTIVPVEYLRRGEIDLAIDLK